MHTRFEQFTSLIIRITKSIRKIKTIEMNIHGLKSSHVSCLYYLYICGPMTAGALCEKCEEDKATISRALDYLESNGFVSCESKSAKRYNSPLFLTEKGIVVGKKIADKIDGVLEEISGGMSEEERFAFYRSLTIISNSLETVANKTEGETQ